MAPNLTPESLLAEYPPPIADLARSLCAFIQEQLPEARAVAYGGWRAIGFRHPEAGYIGGIFLFDGHVSIIFERGALLPDPEGILRGETKQTRHVALAPGDPLPLEPLAALLQAATDIGRDLKKAHRASNP